MKNHIRDYATAAFIFYAANGRSAEGYKEMIYKKALEKQSKIEKCSGVSKPTEAAIMRAEAAVNEKLAEIKDMEAVEKTLAELRACSSFYENPSRLMKHERTNIVMAIEIVYFTDAEKELQKGDIHNRVHKAVLEIPASEKTVYRWLGKARKIFAEKRELRT